MKINEKHAAAIVEHAYDSKDDFECIDLVSGIDKQRIPIHPIVLSATSKYFAGLLRSTGSIEKPHEFVLADVDGDAIRTVVDYCYSGDIVLTEKNLVKCLKIATDSEIESLVNKCRQYYSSKLSIKSAVKVLMDADKYDLDDLRQRASELMGSQLDKVLVADILQLNHSMMMLLLEKGKPSDLLAIRLIEWFKHDEVGRCEHMPKMIRLIKLEQLTMEFLSEAVEPIFKRFKCSELILNEYKRRLLNNKQSPSMMRDPLKASQFNERALSNTQSSPSTKDPLPTPQSNEGRNPKNTSIFCIHIEERVTTKIIVDMYDESSNQLIPKRTFTSINAKSIGTVLYENKLFVIGGQWNGTDLNLVTAYDLNTGAMECVSPMRVGRRNFASIVMEKWIYVFGGHNCCSCERYDTETRTWESLKPMSRYRHSASAAILNELIYVVGGTVVSSNLNLLEIFDPKTNEWVVRIPLNTTSNCIRPPLVPFDGFLYIFSDKCEIREYDPASKTCREVRPKIAHNIRNIVAANGRLFAITTNGSYGFVTIDRLTEKKVTLEYCGEMNIPMNMLLLSCQTSNKQSATMMRDPPQSNGGNHSEETSICCVRIEDGPFATVTVEKYDAPSNRFILQLRFSPTKAKMFETVLYGNKVFLIGGLLEEHSYNTNPNQICGNQLRDPFLNPPVYPPNTALTTARTLHSMTAYDLSTGAEEHLNPMKEARYNCTSIVMGKWIYVFGGQNDSYSSLCSCERYDTVTKTWETIESMTECRHSASAAIHNGLIYVVGGTNGSNSLIVAGAYDPKTGKWVVRMLWDPLHLQNITMPLRELVGSVRPPIVASNGYLYEFLDDRGIRVYDFNHKTFAKSHQANDHNIRSIVAANGRLFAITTSGSYGYVTIDKSTEKKVAMDYCGRMEFRRDQFSAPKMHLFTTNQLGERDIILQAYNDHRGPFQNPL